MIFGPSLHTRLTGCSEQDYNAMVSGAKIEPLASPTKRHVPHDDHGVIGEDRDIEKDHLEPLDSPIKRKLNVPSEFHWG